MNKFTLLLSAVLVPTIALAEGSKDLFKQGQAGYRAQLMARGNAQSSAAYDPFPTSGVQKVYAKAGERIYAGSSVGGSTLVRLYDPTGAAKTWSNANATNAGKILNRAQELAGPKTSINTTGYEPLWFDVVTEGIYEVQFENVYTATDGTTLQTAYADMAIAKESFTQSANTSTGKALIAAWDVSVGTGTNKNTIVNGRVYTRSLNLTGFNGNFNSTYLYSKVYVLTPQGYIYEVDNNGNNGASFNFFSNNKGVTNSNGNPTYKSLNANSISGNTIDPRTEDNGTNITNKIFYNVPDIQNFPATAKVGYSKSAVYNHDTWLRGSVVLPEISDVYVTCDAKIVFTSNLAGRYQILFDGNDNNSYNDATDIFIHGPSVVGRNEITLDTAQVRIINSISSLPTKLSLKVTTGEIHFPFADMESNLGGIKIKRLNTTAADANTVYWDNSNITISTSTNGAVTPNPVKSLDGISSVNGANKWGDNTSGKTEQKDQYGNEKVIDTWTFVYDEYVSEINRFQCLTYSGSIWNDVNVDAQNANNSEKLVSGTTATSSTTVSTGTNLYVYATNADGIIVDKATVGADGKYAFAKLPANTSLKISLAKENYAIGQYADVISLPNGWDYVSYKINNATGVKHNSNAISVTTATTGIANFNIGIYNKPQVGSGTTKLYDQGSNNLVNIPTATFSNVATSITGNASLNAIVLTAFPANVTSIKVDNNVYTAQNFPAQGLNIPTNAAGIPTSVISIDPSFEGRGDVVLKVKAIDVNSQLSKNTGEVVLQFGGKIAGNLWNDFNGNLTQNNDEAYVTGSANTNATTALITNEPLFVYITNQATGEVLYKTTVDANGKYYFENIYEAIPLNVIVSTVDVAKGSIMNKATLPTGWNGVGINNSNATTLTSELKYSISNLVDNVLTLNFGLQQPPVTVSNTQTILKNPKEFDVLPLNNTVATTTGFLPTLVGTDAETPSNELTFKVTKLPYTVNANNDTTIVPATLSYDGIVINTANFPDLKIANFDPALVAIQLIGSGYDNVKFDYLFIDQANSNSNTATYSIAWTTALPLDLVSFKAVNKNGAVNLEWLTNNEDQVSHFEVEYALGNANWVNVGKVQAQNTMGIHQYTFKHQPTASGTHLYRLKMVDISNQYKYSVVRQVMTNLGNDIVVYPNPARDKVTLKGIGNYDELTIIDVNGKIVMHQKIDANQLEIDVAGFVNGQYFIQLVDEYRNILVIKLFVQKL